MLDLRTQYPSQTIDGGADYPLGRARNVSVPGDGTGTPWEQALVNDLLGFWQGLVTAAGITVSGIPDTAVLSDALDALKKLTRRIGCQVQVTGTAVPDDEYLTMASILRQSADAGFFIMDGAGEEAAGADIRFGAPVQGYYYMHFSGLVSLPSSGANPATAELRLSSSGTATTVYGRRWSSGGVIAVSGGCMLECGPTINVDELTIQNKSGTELSISEASLTIVRIGSEISGW